MRPDQPRDELLAPLLVAYDEAIEHHVVAPDEASLIDDAELAAELRQARQCLELLDRVRRLDARGPKATFAGDSTIASQKTDAIGRSTLPKQIGRFIVERELGRGGLGVVLLARDPELGRHVAVKIPRANLLAGDEIERRFLREAEVAARLSHPHLVPLHEIGRDGELLYLVTEYCRGETLAQWIRSQSGGVPPRQAATIVSRLAEAVHYAHSRGVLHRDIKPSNVLMATPELRESSAEPTENGLTLPAPADALWPKLTDFGMARLLESADGHTRTGAVLGTPAYMAPEQADGSRAVDIRADIYALGAVLYELLTGRPPYGGASDLETLRQLLLGEPIAPRAVNAAVPRDLEAICLKCLARSREARYPAARELADDLERFLEGKPTRARPLSVTAQLVKWIRRRPAVAALLAVVIAATVGMFSVVLVYNARLQDEVVRADEARERAEHEAEESRRLLHANDIRRAHEAFLANNVQQTLSFLDAHLPKPTDDADRGFAWRYVRGLCDQQDYTLHGHAGDVFSLAWSPDGKQIATAGKDGTVRIWRLPGEQQIHELRGHADEVTCVAWSPNGQLLASGSEDHTVRLWRVADGKSAGVLKGHTDDVLTIAFSHDSQFLASGGRDKIVRLWSVPERTLQQRSEPCHSSVSAVAFAPNSMLWAADKQGYVKCWNVQDWSNLLPGGKVEVTLLAMAFTHDARLMAAGSAPLIYSWRWSSAGISDPLTFPHGHVESVNCLAASPANELLASSSKDGAVRVWELGRGTETPELLRTIVGPRGRVWSVQFSPDGRFLATASADGQTRIWKITSRNDQELLASTDILAAEISRDGKHLFTADKQGNLAAWNLSTGKKRTSQPVFERPDNVLLRLSPDGRFLAIGSNRHGTIHIFNSATLDLQRSFSWPQDFINALAWSPNGQQLAYGRGDPLPQSAKGFRVIDAMTGRSLLDRKEPQKTTDLQFSRDGERLAIISNRLKILDARTGAVLHELDEAHTLDYSSDGRILVSSKAGEVTFWDARTYRKQRVLTSQDHRIEGLRVSPGGKVLATGTLEASGITLWDVRTGQELIFLETDRSDVKDISGLIFSMDESQLFATGYSRDAAGQKATRIWRWSIPAGR